MEAPDAMFFPLGVVLQFRGGKVEPVLDPECGHDVQCVLECETKSGWRVFLSKLRSVLSPKPEDYILTIHSLALCDIELARGHVTAKGARTWINHYTF